MRFFEETPLTHTRYVAPHWVALISLTAGAMLFASGMLFTAYTSGRHDACQAHVMRPLP